MIVSAPAIEAWQLQKSFGKTTALAPLDLVVPRGAIFALVGHNGAGKTTLIKLLLNMIQPTGGSSSVFGSSSATLKGPSFQQIGYVSENQEMPEWMTVGGMMQFLRPFYPKWDEGSLLADLDLPADRKLKNLSRGMRMKAALASVLAFRPPLIVMDEPFSGLDPLVRDELIETLMDRISDEVESGDDGGTTILISSHDLAEVESFATHVAFLHQGKLLFAEPMMTLTARFRDVTAMLSPADAGKALPTGLPASWLMAEANGSMVRFVYTGVGEASLEEELQRVLPGATLVQAEPMTLRTIFLALVKSNRERERSRA